MYRSVLLMLGIGICATALGSDDDLIRGQWRMAGHDAANSRNQPAEMLISPRNVHSLTMKWVFITGGDTTALTSSPLTAEPGPNIGLPKSIAMSLP